MAVNAYYKYEAKSSVTSLLSGLERMGEAADDFEARKKRQAKNGGIILLAGLILTAIGAVALSLLLVLSIPLIIGGLVLLVYSLVTGGNIRQQRKRLEIAKERLAMIQADAKPEKPFELRLCLRSIPVQLSQETWTARKNGKQQLFEDSWFSLEGPLLDGTVLTDEIKALSRKRTYSNARGKRKTKTRLTYLVNVRFSYPMELYGDARPAEQALRGEMKVGPSATLRSVRVTEKAIALKATVASEQEITQTAGMLSVGAYRILNLARRMAARKRGNAQ